MSFDMESLVPLERAVARRTAAYAAMDVANAAYYANPTRETAEAAQAATAEANDALTSVRHTRIGGVTGSPYRFEFGK